MMTLLVGIGWSMGEFSWDVKYAGLQIMASKVKASKPFQLSLYASSSKTGILVLEIFIGFCFCPVSKMK